MFIVNYFMKGEKMANNVRLTTTDNPYNPFTQFDAWLRYDENYLEYFTCSYLARITIDSDALSDEERLLATEAAIDEIVEINSNGKYAKVYAGEEYEWYHEVVT